MAGNLFEELKRRKVFKVGAAYAVVAWLAVQGASIAFPAFEAPAWAMRVFIFVALLGLPVALVLAWVLEATPEGMRVDPTRTGTRAMVAVAALLAIAAIGWFVAPHVGRGPGPDTPTTAADPAIAGPRPGATGPYGASTASAQSIAVLPFDNLSSDPEQAYFSDGLSEDLITALSQAGGLKVISRNSSFRFRDTKQAPSAIGQALGVARLLSGSVRRAGTQVRISATLTDVADGRTLWSKKYDRPYADLFALQDEITTEVAKELQARLLPVAQGVQNQSDRPPSGNLEAYNAYLQGRFHADRSNPVDFEKAFMFYRRAIALDPNYAQAHAALGTALGRNASIYQGGAAARAALAEARAAIETARALAPDLAFVRVAQGGMRINGELRWADGVRELREAVRMAPKSALAVSELAQSVNSLGRLDESIALSRRALQLDPLNTATWYWYSITLTAQGRFDEAEQAARRTIELQPASDVGYAQLAFVLDRRGRRADALGVVRDMRPGVYKEMALAIVSQKGGDPAAADAALQALIAHQSESAAYQIAEAYGARGDADQVFAWLERAWENRDPGLRRVLYDPYLAPYRKDPRFVTFLTRIGLSEQATARE